MRNVSRCLLVAVATLVLASCGSDSSSNDPGAPEATATPFILDGLPDDFVPVRVGEGGASQDWGTDWGSDSPFVVLGQGDLRVKVAARGTEYEGEVPGSGQFPVSGSTTEQWNVSGRTTGDDIVLEAMSRDVDITVLDRLLAAVEAEGRRSAPSVDDLPDGWEVIGHSDADIVTSWSSGRAPSGGFGATWVRGEDVDGAPRLFAVNLPGDTVDLGAWVGDLARPVNWFGDAHGEPIEVDGREAVFVVLDEGEGGPDHVVLSRMADGSVLGLSSSGNELLTREQLVDLAASARPATQQEWEQLTAQADRP